MVLSNANIVSDDRIIVGGSLLIEDEQVRGVFPYKRSDGIDLNGGWVLPGLVDLHYDSFDLERHPRPGREVEAEDALTLLQQRCLSAGILTVAICITFAWDENKAIAPELRAKKLVCVVNEFKKRAIVEVRIHARCEIGNPKAIPIIEQLAVTNMIDIVSFMDHRPGQGQFRDTASYIKYKQRQSPEMTEEEILSEMHASLANLPNDPWILAERLASICSEKRIPMFSHDDDTLEKVRRMKQLGVTVSEFPLTEDAAQAANSLDMFVAMGAPNFVFGGSHVGFAKASEMESHGLLNIIVSDYHPHSLLWSVMPTCNNLEQVSQMVRYATKIPAGILCQCNSGMIQVGAKANLIVVPHLLPNRRPTVYSCISKGEVVFTCPPCI